MRKCFRTKIYYYFFLKRPCYPKTHPLCEIHQRSLTKLHLQSGSPTVNFIGVPTSISCKVVPITHFIGIPQHTLLSGSPSVPFATAIWAWFMQGFQQQFEVWYLRGPQYKFPHVVPHQNFKRGPLNLLTIEAPQHQVP